MLFRKGHEQRRVAPFHATTEHYPRDKSVSQLVEMWAQRTPQAIAVSVGEQTYSYDELNRRANQLAHYIRRLGVGPNVRVAVCVERSFEMIVAWLGILKAGGAYIGLDAGYPEERLAFLIKDAQAPVFITQRRLAKHLDLQQTQVVYMDSDAALLERQSMTNPVFSATLSDLMYVVYTSGSTGRPKGVQIRHEGFLNLIFWHHRYYGITARDRATNLMSPSFDVAGYELWPYLTAGASVHIVDEHARVDMQALYTFLLQKGITFCSASTLQAESLISMKWPAGTPLRYVTSGGDVLHRYPPAGLPFALVNSYGPAEATVQVAAGIVPPTPHAEQLPTLGYPISNVELYILDEEMRPLPVGEAGELYIGGVGVGAGYLNRPELTAEKFVPHPYSTDPTARLYKTGDLVRALPDGQLAFLGRIDQQVKIRGYRIEPGEIVAILNRQPAIQTSYVMAREDTPGDKRLVAYLVVHPGTQVQVGVLRNALLEFLPEYMVPAAFVTVDALPITPNGKIDRAALPAPAVSNVLLDEVLAAPTTPMEIRVAEIVSALLGVQQIDIDQNFFLLGGHSLLGAQVIGRISEIFDLEIPLSVLYEAPTVRTLSVQIEQRLLEKIATMSEEEARSLLGLM